MTVYGYEKQKRLMEKIGYADYFDYWKEEIGLSPYDLGQWHFDFVKMLNDVFDIKNKMVLDIGCSGGITTKLMRDQCNASEAFGCDVNPNVIDKTPFLDIKSNLIHCDTTEMSSHFSPGFFDFINSHMVFEHFPDWEYSINVAKEISVLLNNGGIFFCVLDCSPNLQNKTESDLIAIRESGINVDITHTNVQDINKWKDLFSSVGLVDLSTILLPIVNSFVGTDGFSFYEQYNWDMLCFGKGKVEDCILESFIIDGILRLSSLLEQQRENGLERKDLYKRIIDECYVNIMIRSVFEKFI